MSAKSAWKRRQIDASTGSGPWFFARSCRWHAPCQRSVRDGQVEGPERHLTAGLGSGPGWSGRPKLVVLVTDRGTEEERRPAVQLEDQAGQVSRTFVVQPLLAQAAGLDVAVVVEDGERVAVLEHPGPVVGDAGRGQDMVRVALRRSARHLLGDSVRHVMPSRARARRRAGRASRAGGGSGRPDLEIAVPAMTPLAGVALTDAEPVDRRPGSRSPSGRHRNARAKARRQARRSSAAVAPTASTAAAMSSTTKPVTPSSMTSGTEPLRKATTGVPQASASIITRPNGSGQSIGNSKAQALPRNSSFVRAADFADELDPRATRGTAARSTCS